MKRIYHDFLTAEFLDKTASRAGFRDAGPLEDFVMDFELHNIIRSQLDTCLRGGMATPFHLDRGMMRLSRDVDLFAFETVECAGEAMQGLVTQQDKYGVRVKKERVGPALSHLPLLQYKIHYKSAFGQTRIVKLDIFCDPRLKDVPCKAVKSGFGLRFFSTKHSIRVLDDVALVADKITSLSDAPVGYGAERRGQMHKQIYDIASLLRRLPDIDLPKLVGAYELLASSKGSFHAWRGEPAGPSAAKIAASVPSSVLALLDREKNMALTRDFSNGFSSFKGTYLGGNRYLRIDHHANTLLVVLFSKRLLDGLTGTVGMHRLEELHRQTVKILSGLENPSLRLATAKIVEESIEADDPSPDRYKHMLEGTAYLTHRIRLEGAA